MRRALDNTLERSDVEAAMRHALDLASQEHPHPNPRVGALILAQDGSVVSRGTHVRPGGDHAEVAAIGGRRWDGHTMVVTLEPCHHTARTPPCTQAILDAGITSVIVGADDPDARVAGRGIAALREAGVEVHTGVLADEVEAIDRAYFHHRRTGRAFVTLKLAATLDGQVAASDGTSQWITGPEARIDVHRTRAANDAVLVGAGTAITDDPALTVRLDGYAGPQPRPVVLAGTRRLPADLKLRERDPLILRNDTDPLTVARTLPEHGILSVLVEGGPTVAASFLRSGVADEIHWYIGAKLAGGTGMPALSGRFATMGEAIDVTIVSMQRMGRDLKVIARLGEE